MFIVEILKKINNLFTNNIKKSLFFLIFLLLLSSIFELLSLAVIPAYISYIISGEFNFLKISDDNFGASGSLLLKNFFIFIILIVFLVKAFFLFFLNYFELRLLKKIKLVISYSLMGKYLNSDYVFFINNNSSILSNNLITETNNSVNLIQSIITMCKEIILLIVVFVLLFIYKPVLSIFILLSLIFAAIFFYLFTFKILKKNSIERTNAAGFVFKFISQSLVFIKDIKVFQKEDFFYKRYSKYLNILQSKLATHELIARMPKIFFELFGIILIFSLLLSSGLQEQSKNSFVDSLPFLSLVLIAIIKLLPSFKSISGSLTHIVAYTNSFLTISNEITIKNQDYIQGSNNKISINKNIDSDLALEIKNISFQYNKISRPLKNVSIEIKKNIIVGIIGQSGSGKSTLINIILGLLIPEGGTIKINSNKQNKLQDEKVISYVPQDILILDDKLKNNIAFGIEEDQINDDKVLEAIKLSGLSNFYNQNGSNLNLSLGERGAKVSGGEKQRIGIARALYFKPEILILDESTSSLDSQIENDILQEVLKLKNITVIMISHKLSTLQICKEVYYLKNGKIQDTDTINNLKVKYPEIEFHEKQI